MSTRKLKRNTILGLVISLCLAVGKFIAGVLGHSTALIADAVESFADAVSSIIVWQGIRIASKDPDERHPYGYGRAETVAAFCVGALLIAAAAVIVVKSAGEMLRPHQPPAKWTLLVMLAVIVIKEALFRIVLKGANDFQSDAARADAWHHRADAITSIAAFAGIIIAIWGPALFNMPKLVFADEAAAIIASIIILYTALLLMRPALLELLDATNPTLAEEVRTFASTITGVALIEKVHARKSGRGYLIDLHLHVAPDLPVREAHALSGKVKAHIRQTFPSVQHVLIHIEPDERPITPLPHSSSEP